MIKVKDGRTHKGQISPALDSSRVDRNIAVMRKKLTASNVGLDGYAAAKVIDLIHKNLEQADECTALLSADFTGKGAVKPDKAAHIIESLAADDVNINIGLDSSEKMILIVKFKNSWTVNWT